MSGGFRLCGGFYLCHHGQLISELGARCPYCSGEAVYVPPVPSPEPAGTAEDRAIAAFLGGASVADAADLFGLPVDHFESAVRDRLKEVEP